MAVKKVWIGSTGPFLFDDAILYIDEEGVIAPDNQQAIATNGQIVVQSAPTSDVHVVRKVDLDALSLSFGTMAYQDADAVAITGGSATLDYLVVNDQATINGLLNTGGPVQLGGAGPITIFIPANTNGINNTGDLAVTGRTGLGGAVLAGYDLHCHKDALFSTKVGIQIIPLYGLDVGVAARIAALGVGTPPESGLSLVVAYPSRFDGPIHINYLRNVYQALTIHPDNDTGAGSAILFLNAASGAVGSVATTATATFYNTSSDRRLKHAITKLTGALDVICRTRPITHLWNADDSRGYGFLADELQKEIPSAVNGEPDAVNDDGSVKPQQVDHSRLVPWLTAAVQELRAQVQVLTTRIAALEEAQLSV